MNAEYDMVIIGCGPAGLSAAINAKARNKHVIVLGVFLQPQAAPFTANRQLPGTARDFRGRVKAAVFRACRKGRCIHKKM